MDGCHSDTALGNKEILDSTWNVLGSGDRPDVLIARSVSLSQKTNITTFDEMFMCNCGGHY